MKEASKDSLKQRRSYNLKFNKQLFRELLVNELKRYAIGCPVSLALLYLLFRFGLNLPELVLVLGCFVFLYIPLAGGIGLIIDWREYRRMHQKRKKA